jgi:hypothetical protein
LGMDDGAKCATGSQMPPGSSEIGSPTAEAAEGPLASIGGGSEIPATQPRPAEAPGGLHDDEMVHSIQTGGKPRDGATSSAGEGEGCRR